MLQQTGSLKLFKNGFVINQNLLTLDSVYAGSEKGVLGLTFDPNFSSNGYIYIYYTVNVEGNTYNGITLQRGGSPIKPPIRNKIVRYTMNGDNIILASKRTILDLDVVKGFQTGINHDGGQLRFGQDGKLYLAVGDGEQWCPAPCQGNTACNWGSCNVSSTSADDNTSFHGKILRMNADGSPATDNPYFLSPTPVQLQQKYFYAKGLRNPFTMSFKTGTNDLYINDVGSSGAGRREEINKITSTSIKHLGWQASGGGEGILNNSNFEDPIYAYQGGSTTITGCGIVGGTFINSSLSTNAPWPSQYNNKYFFMDFCNGWINAIDFENGNTITNFANNMYSNLGNASSGMGNLVLEQGLDGNLYFVTRSVVSGNSGLYRISYQPTTVNGVTISGASNSISTLNGEITLTGGVIPQNASIPTVNWFVMPASAATINSAGVLTAINDGIVTITGKSEANPSINAIYVVTITNQIPVTSVSITGPNAITTNKGTATLTGIAFPASANQEIIWSIVGSTPSSATGIISTNGVLSATGSNGQITIIGVSKKFSNISLKYVVSISGQEELSTSTKNVKQASNQLVAISKPLVYPNPNNGVFNIELDLVKGKDVTIYVMSQLGNDVYKQDIKNFSGKTQMNLSHLAKGMYRITISYELGSYHEKIIIQ